MAREGGYEIVEVGQVNPTREMQLKFIQVRKQKCISTIAKAKQDIEDIQKGKIAEIEYQILHAEAELKKLNEHEVRIKNSVDVQPQ